MICTSRPDLSSVSVVTSVLHHVSTTIHTRWCLSITKSNFSPCSVLVVLHGTQHQPVPLPPHMTPDSLLVWLTCLHDSFLLGALPGSAPTLDHTVLLSLTQRKSLVHQ